MISDELMLKVENVSKVYKLGEIGGTTLRDELQRLGAKIRKKEDPTKKVGAKNYNKGEKFKALDSVSFEVKKGERIGIIGHNGAGKSTLLKLISRVTGPTDGKIYLNGRVASMLEVGTGFHPELTGRENIYMNGAILGMTKKEIDTKIENIIEFSEVRQFIDTPVKRYSSGMYVKLAFSVAVHLDSEIVIMDEVLAVGDAGFQQKCIAKMKSISENNNKTILYVSHNMNTIRQLCNRVIVLKKGSLIFDGDVEKGINMYNDSLRDNNSSFKNLSEIDRRDHEKGNGLFLEKFSFLHSKNTFSYGTPISFDLSYSCSKSIDGEFTFKFIVLKTDESPVCTFHSKKMKAEVGHRYTKRFLINTSFLVPDAYILKIIVFSKDLLGNLVTLDCIRKAALFDVVNDNNSGCFEINWNYTYWGSAVFENIDALLIEDQLINNDGGAQ